jgi:hypothetical protein
MILKNERRQRPDFTRFVSGLGRRDQERNPGTSLAVFKSKAADKIGLFAEAVMHANLTAAKGEGNREAGSPANGTVGAALVKKGKLKMVIR